MTMEARKWLTSVVKPGRDLIRPGRHFPAVYAYAMTGDEHEAIRDFARVLFDTLKGKLWLSGPPGRRTITFFVPLPDGQKMQFELRYSPLKAVGNGRP